MKNAILLFLAAIVLAGFAACAKREDTPPVPDEIPSGPASPESDSQASIPEREELQKGLEPGNREINPPDGAAKTTLIMQGTSFAIYLPGKWHVTGNTILEDNRVAAEIQLVSPVDDADTFFAGLDTAHSDAEYGRELEMEGIAGRYYLFETEREEGGVTAKQNEIIYYLDIGGHVLSVSFYPAFGMGIGTQREEFEQYLATLDEE